MAVAGEMQVTTVRVVGALAVMRFVRTHAVHKIIFTLKVFNRSGQKFCPQVMWGGPA